MKNYQKYLEFGKTYTVNRTYSWLYTHRTADGYYFSIEGINGAVVKVYNSDIKNIDFTPEFSLDKE